MKLTGSKILVEDIRLYAYHGVLEQERRVGGWYRVSISVDYPVEKALRNDNVDDTLNYALLLDIVKEQMGEPSNLLEHVAGRIAESVFDAFPIAEACEIKLTKENPPMGGNTGGASVLLRFKNDKTDH